MKQRIENILWLIVFAVLLTPIMYIFLCSPSSTFFESVVSGLLSTAAALIAGIPLALWVDRAIKHRDEEKNNKTKRKKELELLCLIKEELSFTNNLHEPRVGDIGDLPLQPLKSDLWAAVTSAGKLNIINNHKLLNRITSAYYVINIVKNLEEQAYRSARTATVNFGSKTATELLVEDARKFDTLLSESIAEALNEIYDEILKNA